NVNKDPSIQFFEIDFAQLFKYKQSKIKQNWPSIHPNFPVHYLPHNLNQIDKLKQNLISNGVDPAKKTCWVLEGLLMYMQQSEIHKLLKLISTFSPNKSIITGNLANRRYLTDEKTELVRDFYLQNESPFIWGTDQ